MTTILIQAPKGELPRLRPELLESNQAQVAKNCKLDRGSVRPLKSASFEKTIPASTKTIFKNRDAWIVFNKETSVISSPVKSINDRYYYTNSDGQFKTDNTISGLQLGVPQPDSGPTINVHGPSEGNIERTSVYVYTRVTAWDEESAPSQPSGNVELYTDQYVSFQNLNNNLAHVTHYRIYRTVAGNQSSTYMAVPFQETPGELKYDSNNNVLYDIPVTDIDDAVDGASDSQLSIPLATKDWYEPPSDLHGLTDIGNGIVAGISGKQVCFAEPWIPYAWPTKYQYSMDAEGVALGSIAGIPVGLTKQSVYYFEGSDPTSYIAKRISDTQGCVSKRSVVSTLAGIYFASINGLCMANSNGVQVLTRNVWTNEQWQEFDLQNLTGFIFDDVYYGFFVGSSIGFMLHILDEQGVTFVDLDANFLDGYVNPSNDCLYIALDSGKIVELDAIGNLTSTWRSKKFMTSPNNFSCVYISGEKGNSNVKIYGDDVEKFNATVEHNKIYRLPANNMAKEHEIEVQSTTSWWTLAIANSIRELQEQGL